MYAFAFAPRFARSPTGERSRELRRGEQREKKREREKCDVAQRETPRLKTSSASAFPLFCGNLMKTVIEYVHYTKYNACRAVDRAGSWILARSGKSPVRFAVVSPPRSRRRRCDAGRTTRSIWSMGCGCRGPRQRRGLYFLCFSSPAVIGRVIYFTRRPDALLT